MVINVLLTGVGCAGTIGTIYSLRKTRRKIRIVGVDARNDVYGKYLCDKFYPISKPNSPSFIRDMVEICRIERIDVVLPQVNEELYKLSMFKRPFYTTKIAISNIDSVKIANNKHDLMRVSDAMGIPTPEYYLARTRTQLERYITKLGYPEKGVVVKPPVSRGMMGFRIINEWMNRKDRFYNGKPEESIYIKKEQLDFLGERFPALLVMEHLSGREYSVDVLSGEEGAIIAVPRTRDSMRTGISFAGTTVKNAGIIRDSMKLTNKLGLEYAHGYQFKRDSKGVPKLIECNPRIQGTMVLSTLAGANIIYGALKLALNEELPKFNVKWGTRLFRDWGAIKVFNDKKVGEI